ncbi:MAG: acetolactate synthase small subunit [Nitrospina sp.]|jgi:acetolactate synthase I/III small subunit|nr:acetolactate synthase small subunit [Nitrospina sp.]MDG1844686.1 acetolactate synthase small subunit [Nitrospinaceae bacterium]MBT4127665.1 acetolactate synthase small subunit [Nitrospina sp.]MBT5258124.1 acetolactate synthase small subunit [Nitrospina sp.]MBT5968253.1 acetolactate synthase small subunit [Nitrospina sp.]|tara:strand:- start:15095 stop:15583 length:489 start_codon:yes stop_codon:yes gene_type:complete
MQHTISVLVVNQSGVLSRISGLFSGRGFNIESLNVAETNEPGISRMTIITLGDDKKIEQITKQLNKLIDVIKVVDLTEEHFVDRELILVKMNSEPRVREEILRIVDIFRAKVIDVSPDNYTVEITGDEGKIKGFLDLLKPLGIKEIVRSGRIAISRGSKSIN